MKQSQKLANATAYTIKISKGANSASGSIFENEFSYTFTTLGPVKVISVSPGNGTFGNGLLNVIRVTFDQPVDKISAQSKFSITPSVQGNFSWDGNTMIFKPSSNLSYYTRYNYSIAAGVKSIHGQDSQSTFFIFFRYIGTTSITENTCYKTRLPFFMQYSHCKHDS